MQYKDTLKLYDELLAGGATESSARANATQLGAFGEFLDDFKSSNDKSFREIESTGSCFIVGPGTPLHARYFGSARP